MSLISFSTISDGTTATASQVNTPLSTIYNDYNGNITNANISASAAIAQSKLSLALTGAQQTQRNTSSTTASTAYTATLGDGFTDSVTVTIGATGMALVSIYGIINNSGANFTALAYAISGASTKSASDFRCVGSVQTAVIQAGATFLETGLTAGSTTFTINYRVGGGTGTFNGRCIVVTPL